MKLALCLRDNPVSETVRLAKLVESLGFDELWMPDTARGPQRGRTDGRLTGRDAFCVLSAVFSATTALHAGIGVAAAPMHPRVTLALLAGTLQEHSGGRFSLGVGLSHPETAAEHGIPFPEKPIRHMRERVRELKEYSISGMGFGGRWPVLLAALGPQMLKLAASEADGAVLTWLSPRQAMTVVRSIADVSATPFRTVLYVRVMPAQAARRETDYYLQLANYRRHFALQGLHTTDEIAASTILPADDLGAARQRIAEYAEAGIETLCLYPKGLTAQAQDQLLQTIAEMQEVRRDA